MGIPNPQAASYNSLQRFISVFKQSDTFVATTNLYSIHFAPPRILLPSTTYGGGTQGDTFNPNSGELRDLLDYYAKSVNLPSKQVTTGQITDVGSAVKYATNAAFSQINITFQVPRSQYTRNFFERWISKMTNDANQYTDFYNDYCCPTLMIYKWERGGGERAADRPGDARARRDGNLSVYARRNKLTAAWELRNVFPYNIGSIQLSSDEARVMELNVGFYYERYRFFTEDKFDDPGVETDITISSEGLDNNTDPSTDRNTTA
jgi:hypothetical protein